MNLDIKMKGNEWEKDFEFEARSNGEVVRGITALSIEVGAKTIATAKIELEFFRDEDRLELELKDIDATVTTNIGGKVYQLVEVEESGDEAIAHIEVSEAPPGSTLHSLVGQKLNDEIMNESDASDAPN